MASSEFEESLVMVLNDLIKDNNLKTARKILDQTKYTFTQYQEFNTKVLELETKHE
jgi:hypothetical protein